MSWTDVNPGEEGFIYRPYTGGIEQNAVYTEGTVFIAPWNEMITYNILQQSRNYSSKVMEKNGMEIGIDVTINYNPMQNNTAKLHLKHGKAFESSFIDAKVRGVIKDVIGRYTYEEIYSTKREALETEMDTIFQSEFPANFISYNFCEIADVNLPENVKIAITEKETQKQRNQKAKELEEYLTLLEEAKRRDHRKLGKEMELFAFSEKVGMGLPLWLPKGADLRLRLENFLKDAQRKSGYEPVITPHIGNKELYITSGHYAKYGEDSFQAIKTPAEGEEYLLKPMNCPHHCEMYNVKKWSYR